MKCVFPFAPIGGGYAFAQSRIGLCITNPCGKSIYIQPGDDESTMMENIMALDEVSPDPENVGRGILADMLLGVYFS